MRRRPRGQAPRLSESHRTQGTKPMPVTGPRVMPSPPSLKQLREHVEAFGGTYMAAIETAEREAEIAKQTKAEIAAFKK
jgi:hypothetical protein